MWIGTDGGLERWDPTSRELESFGRLRGSETEEAIKRVRAILEAAGIRNILTKQLGSRNPNNVVKATMDGLRQLRTVEDFAAKRGLTVPQVLGFDHATEKREHPAAKSSTETAEAVTEQKEAVGDD